MAEDATAMDKPAEPGSTPVRYICAACARTFPLEEPLWRCPACHGHLNLTPGSGLQRGRIRLDARSLWRYADALAVGDPAIGLGEGCTPLVTGHWEGRPVRYKLEFLAPTASFKDRGIAVMLNYLIACGLRSVFEDSSGNGGASLAAYAAAAGISCRILVPETTSRGKIVQISATGAEVVPIAGSRQDVAEAALREAEHGFYASHNWHPLFLEGTKTLGYEMWEDLGFHVPDNIVAPLGGGSILLGCHLAFTELLRAGEIDRLPRLFGVQPANCAPLHAAFAAGPDAPPPVDIRPTIAEGIAVSRPVRVREVIDALRASGGRTLAVTEVEIATALRALLRKGLFVEPTSAAAAAGLTRAQREGDISPSDTTILVLSGSGLKAAAEIGALLG